MYQVDDLVTPVDDSGVMRSKPVAVTAIFPPGHPDNPDGGGFWYHIEGTTTGYPECQLEPGNPETQRAILMRLLHRGGPFAYWWTIPGRRSHWWPVGDPLPIPRGDHVYFGVNPSVVRKGENERAKITNIAAINCLFAEFDAKDFGDKAAARAHVETLDARPSVIIDSGGGYHAYWLFREPFELAMDDDRKRAAEAQARWVGLVGGDPAAKDLARVLRVPGTMNHKPEYGPDFPLVVITRADWDCLYDLDELETLMPPRPDTLARMPSSKNFSTADDISAAAHNLERLAAWRCDDYNPWVEVGMALAELGDVGFAMWDGWSQQSVKYQPGECDKKWSTFDPGAGCTLASLAHWAAEDDPQPRTGTVKSAQKRDAPQERAQPPEPFFLTDMGNGERLVRQHGQDLRYCKRWSQWLAWDQRRWAADDTDAVTRLAKETVTAMYAEVARIPDDDRRAALAKHAIKSQAAYRIRAMLSMAESELPVVTRPADFDQDPWLFNVQNGTVDLCTGELLSHQREKMITRLAPVDYDPSATCPLWDKFLDRIMDGNEALIGFLQRAVGYSLTGETSERCLFIEHGTGDNGKTVFLETLATLTGEYCKETPVSTLMIKRGDSIPNDLAALKSARIVTAAESEEEQRLAESLIKHMTGGDRISARFLHAEWFDFRPQFKIWLATNHKPRIRGTDNAIWRRIRLIPFGVTIPEEEQNKDLARRLATELPGILNWAIEGCLAWQREGLSAPAEVKEATQNYRGEMDHLTAFLEDCCELDSLAQITAKAIHEAYTKWCKANGDEVMTKRAFGLRLGQHGFMPDRDAGVRSWWGIRLLEMPKQLELPDEETKA